MTTLLDMVTAYLDGKCPAMVLADYLEESGDLVRANRVRADSQWGENPIHVLAIFPEFWQLLYRKCGEKVDKGVTLLMQIDSWARTLCEIPMTTLPLKDTAFDSFLALRQFESKLYGGAIGQQFLILPGAKETNNEAGTSGVDRQECPQ